MRCRLSIFILFSFLFTVNSKTYASTQEQPASNDPDTVPVKLSKFFVAKLSPKLCYEIDIKNRMLINLTSTLTLSYAIYKNDFFSAGLGISVKWLDCLVRIITKKKKGDYKIPIEFLSVHIITFDFYYVNVYFLRVPIYDLIWLRKNSKDSEEVKKATQYGKRNNLVTNFGAYLTPVFQLNLNRIFSDFFYSEKDVI